MRPIPFAAGLLASLGTFAVVVTVAPLRMGYCSPSVETIHAISDAVAFGDVAQSRAVPAFEEAFAARMGRKYAIACSSGTSAETVALAAIRRGQPYFNLTMMRADSFIAVPNAAYAAGYRGLHFYDYGEPPEPYRDALHIAVDVMGVPEPLLRGNRPIEDFSEALGSVDEEGRACGNRGSLCGITSFFVTHMITAGEGGAIVTDDEGFAQDCRAFRDHGRWGAEPRRLLQAPGFNAKMTTIEALLAADALANLDYKIEARRGNAKYMDQLLGRRWVQPGVVPHGYPVFLASEAQRDAGITALTEAGIEARPYFHCLPTDTWCASFTDEASQWSKAHEMARCWLYVPIHEGVSREDCERMASIIGGFL